MLASSFGTPAGDLSRLTNSGYGRSVDVQRNHAVTAGRIGRPALLAGVLAALVTGAWSWRPSAWGDEAATISYAARPFGQAVRASIDGDPVHATYYVLMHLVVALPGPPLATVRLASAAGVGLATAGMVVLAARLTGSRRRALVAAALLAALPVVTWSATEARYTSLSIALAVWTTYTATRLDDGRGPQAAYVVLTVVSTYLFAYTALLLLAHLIALVATRASRRARVTVVVAAVVTALAGIPLLAAMIRQRDEVGDASLTFLHGRSLGVWFGDFHSPDHVVIVTWPAVALMVLGWGTVVAAVVAGVRRARAGSRVARDALAWGLPWILVPPVVLSIGGLAIGSAVFTNRYVAFAAPGLVVLVVGALAGVRVAWLRVVAGLFALLALVPYVEQRLEGAKNTDWGRVAAVVAARREPGDAVLSYPSTRERPPSRTRDPYPAAYAGLRVVDGWQGRSVTAAQAAGLRRIWVVYPTGKVLARDPTYRSLLRLGFRASSALTPPPTYERVLWPVRSAPRIATMGVRLLVRPLAR